jgi:hypothetical protein
MDGNGKLSRYSILLSGLLLLLTFLLFTAPQYVASVRASDGLKPYWGAADVWMESAECARNTGVVLALCRNGRQIPFADGSSGDDPGHALAFGIYSAISHKAVSLKDVSVFNSGVNYTAIVLLTVLFFCLQLPLVSFLLLTFGTFVADELQMLGPHPAAFGVACFAAVLPIALLGLPAVPSSRTSFSIWIVIGILCLAVATLLRQAIGLMGVVAGCSAVIAYFMIYRTRTRAAFTTCAVLIAGIFLSYQTPAFVSLARNAAYHLPPANFPEQHGIWHNVYIGLGAVENPFGLTWSDGDALKAVNRVDPNIVYTSARYYAVLRDEYFSILKQHPREVAGVYLKKLDIISESRLPFWLESWKFWEAAVFLCVVAAYARVLLYFRRSGFCAADAVFAVGVLFTGFFVGQGVLVHFAIQYLFPIHLFLLLCAGAIVEYLRLAFIGPVGRPLPYGPEPVQQPVRG